MKIKEEEMIKMLLNGMPRDILINTNYTLYKDSNLKDLEIKQLQDRIDKAINRISLIRMDRDTSIETHKALDEILNVLRGSEQE